MTLCAARCLVPACQIPDKWIGSIERTRPYPTLAPLRLNVTAPSTRTDTHPVKFTGTEHVVHKTPRCTDTTMSAAGAGADGPAAGAASGPQPSRYAGFFERALKAPLEARLGTANIDKTEADPGFVGDTAQRPAIDGSTPAVAAAPASFKELKAHVGLGDYTTGLSSADAAAKLKADGPNEMPTPRGSGKAPAWLKDARARQASFDVVHVLRDGALVEVPERDVVVGDVVLLVSGGKVFADIRVILTHGEKFCLDESALTGEPVSVERFARMHPSDASLTVSFDNVAYMGTAVDEGVALGVVVSTGPRTFMGCVATIVFNDEYEEAHPLYPAAVMRSTARDLYAETSIVTNALEGLHALASVRVVVICAPSEVPARHEAALATLAGRGVRVVLLHSPAHTMLLGEPASIDGSTTSEEDSKYDSRKYECASPAAVTDDVVRDFVARPCERYLSVGFDNPLARGGGGLDMIRKLQDTASCRPYAEKLRTAAGYDATAEAAGVAFVGGEVRFHASLLRMSTLGLTWPRFACGAGVAAASALCLSDDISLDSVVRALELTDPLWESQRPPRSGRCAVM